MANKRKARTGLLSGWLTEPSLFDDDEPTFVDNFSKRKVYIHLVPAPWSRVILLSLCYAIAINFVKLLWFEFVGRPSWYPTDPHTAAMSAGEGKSVLDMVSFTPFRKSVP